jgi:peptidoglycan/xylan/chitin deacetylase (PgdA/CDA1 family)
MKARPRSRLDTALRWSPAQLLFRVRAAGHLTVLAYHGIDDPDRFRQQLRYLVRTTRPVSLEQVAAAVTGTGTLPERATLLTFDDGARSLVESGLPLLGERGLPAVAFVVAGLLDTDTPFWWTEVERLAGNGGRVKGLPGRTPAELVRRLKRLPDAERLAAVEELRRTADAPAPPMPQLRRSELARLESAGVAVGNHTLTHPILPRCDDGTVETEVAQAHRALGEALGHPPTAFAYPNGDRDARAERLLATLGYTTAFLFDHRVNPRPPGHPLRISRVRVNSDTGPDRFAAIVSGLHPAVHHVRGGA